MVDAFICVLLLDLILSQDIYLAGGIKTKIVFERTGAGCLRIS